MAGKKKGDGKSQTFTIRLDDRTRFMIDFVTRITGQSITGFIQKSITDAAKPIHSNEYSRSNWHDFWHPIEGFRTLFVIMDESIRASHITPDEEDLIRFVEKYPYCFMDEAEGGEMYLASDKIEILWPDIDDFRNRNFIQRVGGPIGGIESVMISKLLNNGIERARLIHGS